MANATDQYRILVSAPLGTVYIAKLTKTPHVMSATRRKVPEDEFIEAILQYTLSKTTAIKNVMTIVIDDKVVAEIVIKDREAIK